MRHPVFRIGILVLAVLFFSLCPVWGDVFNIKVLSDKTVDLTDLESFCHSATSRWDTNDEKAAALSHWFGVLGNQSAYPYDFAPMEPILQFNTQMNCFCAHWTALYCAVAEGGMGWVGRHYEVGDHTVPEIEYDGRRAYLDNTYKFYCLSCDGKRIIGIEEMDDEDGPCERGPRARYHNLLYHAPMRLCDDIDGYDRGEKRSDVSPIRAWLSGPWLARDAASRAYFAEVLDAAWTKKRWVSFQTGSTHNMYRIHLNLRDNEYYTRYWQTQGKTPEFYYPSSRGKDPDAGENERANGIWLYSPDLSNPKACESATGIRRGGNPKIRAAAGDTEGIIVFKVQPANLVTGAFVKAEIVRPGENDQCIIEVSGDSGHSWKPVGNAAATGTVSIDVNITSQICGSVADKTLRPLFNFLVRTRIKGKGGLNAITIKTVTTINKMSLPKLDLGRNYITADYDKDMQHETLTFTPRLKKGMYKLEAVEHKNLASQDKHQSWSATLYCGSKTEPGHVVYQLEAPRPITAMRMHGALWVGNRDKATWVEYKYRLFNGQWGEWIDVKRFTWATRNNKHPRREQTQNFAAKISKSSVTKIQFKYIFSSNSASVHGAGANLLRMQVDYPAQDATFKPLVVTYNWTEYYEPLPAGWDKGGINRTHTEVITSLPHSYHVNTGGDIRPRVNWIRMHLKGSEPEPFKPGYSDGKDVGAKFEIPSRKYTWGKWLSLKKPYTVSTPPARDNFTAKGDEQELTDGRVKEPQINGPWPAKDLATFKGSDPVQVTVDLGEVTTVGGARADAFQYKSGVRFPESVSVATSEDGTTFTEQSRDQHKAAKYAHNGWPANWPLHAKHDSPKRGVFPDYGLLGNYIFLPFKTPVKARYVRFTVTAQKGAAFQLSEVHVWDYLKVDPWTPRLAHEAPEGR